MGIGLVAMICWAVVGVGCWIWIARGDKYERESYEAHKKYYKR